MSLTLLSHAQLRFEIKEGRFARTEIVDIQVVPLGNSIFTVSWQEKDGATVANVQDYDRGVIYSYATLPGGQFLRMTGTFAVTRSADGATNWLSIGTCYRTGCRQLVDTRESVDHE